MSTFLFASILGPRHRRCSRHFYSCTYSLRLYCDIENVPLLKLKYWRNIINSIIQVNIQMQHLYTYIGTQGVYLRKIELTTASLRSSLLQIRSQQNIYPKKQLIIDPDIGTQYFKQKLSRICTILTNSIESEYKLRSSRFYIKASTLHTPIDNPVSSTSPKTSDPIVFSEVGTGS